MIKATVFALAAVLAAGSIATAAQAGVSTVANAVSGSPNPSNIGQTVTFTATFNANAADCTATIRDRTNAVTLCTTGSTGGTNAATCTATFATAGDRDIEISAASGSMSICGSTGPTYTHTVNAVAAPVPTVGEWTMWGLMGLIALGGGVMLARRSRHLV